MAIYIKLACKTAAFYIYGYWLILAIIVCGVKSNIDFTSEQLAIDFELLVTAIGSDALNTKLNENASGHQRLLL